MRWNQVLRKRLGRKKGYFRMESGQSGLERFSGWEQVWGWIDGLIWPAYNANYAKKASETGISGCFLDEMLCKDRVYSSLTFTNLLQCLSTLWWRFIGVFTQTSLLFYSTAKVSSVIWRFERIKKGERYVCDLGCFVLQIMVCKTKHPRSWFLKLFIITSRKITNSTTVYAFISSLLWYMSE